ncbi:GTP-binding protein ypt5 [Holothuria leucospilota]|uniref:GTP-binding protein ypt5 n=1 Tax=Holothuria leucospilota TaxID=206669 RepID=A0A9Q1BHC9_HOLLE|nr:GTP-binding protein ypt5 [Holothuria leucospilota]
MGAGCSGRSDDLIIGNTSEVPNFKIVLVGDPQVGKTSVFLRYFKNQFDYSYRPTTTVSIENVVKKLNVPEHTIVSVSIWDLPGREEMDLRKSYYRDVDAAIVVVDISDPESVDLAGTWRQDILNHAVISKKRIVNTPEGHRIDTEYEKADASQIPVLLLGNKFDIVEEKLAMMNAPDGEDAESVSEKPVDKDDKEDARKGEVSDGGKGEAKAAESSQEEKMGDGKNEEGERSKRKESTSSKGDEGEVWKYEEEKVKEEKPAEILYLEACCEQHGFVGSVAVSAKEPDGGIHTAIQALVRHLLEHRLKFKALQKMEAVQVKRSKHKRRKAKKVRPDAFQPLELTKVPQLDKLFAQCNPQLMMVHEANLAYEQSMKHFKHLCLDMGVVKGPKFSIEDCFEGIRKVLREEELELVVQEKDGFVELAVKGEEKEEEEKNEEMKELLQTFDSEVRVACCAIACGFEAAGKNLEQMDDHIVGQCSELINEHIQLNGVLAPKEEQHIKDTIDINRARLKHAHLQCDERRQDVESLLRKITAAMLW